MARQAFVISDLHLGGGPADPQLEDFYQENEFVAFLQKLGELKDITLIINGDFIDFAQIPPYQVPDPSYLLWTEDTSLQKLVAASEAHKTCFEALGKFVAAGGELQLVIGNHDLDLVWPKVQQEFQKLIGLSSGDRLSFVVGNTAYEGVWIEHGHSFTPENCPHDPLNFVHAWNQQSYLERVWGTDFLLQFYNDLERRFSFADNVKPMVAVLYYGLKNRWVGAREFLRFALFLKRRGLPLRGLASALLEHETPSVETIVASLDDPDWQKIVIDRLDSEFDTELQAAIGELPDEDKAVLASSGKVPVSEASRAMESAAPGAAPKVLGLFREDRELRAAKDRLAKSGIHHVVFGHTHVVVNGALEGGALFNPGTWIPRIDLSSAAIREKIKQHGITQDMLADRTLYVADRLAVHILCESAHQPHVRMLEVPSFRDWNPKS